MIYEFTRATIKHNFPRAVLMTWRERYFIKRLSAERTQKHKQCAQREPNTVLSPANVWLQECFMMETREVTRNALQRTGYEEATIHISSWSYQIQYGDEFESCTEGALRQKSRTSHLQKKTVLFSFAAFPRFKATVTKQDF